MVSYIHNIKRHTTLFTLIKNKITNEYSTIYTKDLKEFKNLDKFFKSAVEEDDYSFNFEIIEDKKEIKKILDTHFTSRGRTSEYNEDLPSVTKIAYGLFPIDIEEDKYLLRWQNNTPLTEQIGDKEDILSRGTFIHKVLETWVTDTDNRKNDKVLIDRLNILKNTKKPSKKVINEIDKKINSYLEQYIEQSFVDDEILFKIKNLDEMKDELKELALKSLPDFIKEELIFTDTVYSEIFLCVDNYIQGSIDLVVYNKDNEFSIWDFKTTSSVDKKSGKPKFKSTSHLAPYARQLYVYNKLLQKSGMTHIFEDKMPNFNIIQIHLISGKYKKFDIPKNLVKWQGKTVEHVLNWYWATRNDEEYIPEETEDLELEFISL